MLNEKQEMGFKLSKQWWSSNEKNNREFVLAGIAGSGKTFLSTKIIEGFGLHESNVAFITYTGMAAGVLVKRGLSATTIHRMIYNILVDRKTGKMKFIKKDELDPDIKLIVIDEISMVPQKLLNDIMTFKVPVLVMGDPFQLPALFESNTLLNKPDIFLDEPMRQSLDNPILALANHIRKGNNISIGKYSDTLKIVNSNDISIEDYINADQVLMGYNRTVSDFNSFYRSEILDINIDEQYMPLKDEKIICLKNNWSQYITENNLGQYLHNGLIGTASEIKETKQALESTKIDFKPLHFETEKFKNIYCDNLIFEGIIRNESDLYELKNTDERIKKIHKKRYVTEMSSSSMKVNSFDFAYGITVHKSQGSEYDNGIIFAENHSKDRLRWLYTAVTRFKKNLIIIE